MKKLIISALLSSVLFLFSCSKEKKINKDIQGTWKATVWDGKSVDPNTTYTISFAKTGKVEGTGNIVVSTTSVITFSVTQPFKYTIDTDRMNVQGDAVAVGFGLTLPAINEVLKITKHDK